MPIPQPELPCSRFNKDGNRCTGRTARQDRWCGHCDGFTTPKPAAPITDHPFYGNNREAPKGYPPLKSDTAYDISVTRSAQEHFVGAHGGTLAQAETQIRSFLEDLLLHPADGQGQVRNDGCWFIGTKNFRHALVISTDLEAVIAYKTLHAERTYAQVKSGVPSRVSRPSRGKNRPVRWLTEAIDKATADMDPRVQRVQPDAVQLFNVRNGLPRARMEDHEQTMKPALDSLRAALAEWDGVSDLFPDPANPGAMWISRANKGKGRWVLSYMSAERFRDGDDAGDVGV